MDFSLPAEQQLYIGGAYVDAESDETFDNINPATGEVLCRVQQAGEADVEMLERAPTRQFLRSRMSRIP